MLSVNISLDFHQTSFKVICAEIIHLVFIGAREASTVVINDSKTDGVSSHDPYPLSAQVFKK
jgi:hypothetical protein